jgi:hypothetical protein
MFGQQNAEVGSTPSFYVPTLWVLTDGRLRAEYWTGSVGAIYTSFSVADNKWHFVAFVGNVNTQSLYLDGNFIGSRSGTISQSWWTLSSIGTGYTSGREGVPSGTWGFFKGNITNVQIYATALTPQQIQQLYLQGINSPPISNAGLVGWWPLQGNANDYSSYNNNGIIYNAIFVPINVTQLSNVNVSSSPIINQFPIVGKFNGVNSYIEVPNSQSLSISGNQITMEAWIYPTSYPTEGIIFNKENTY